MLNNSHANKKTSLLNINELNESLKISMATCIGSEKQVRNTSQVRRLLRNDGYADSLRSVSKRAEQNRS